MGDSVQWWKALLERDGGSRQEKPRSVLAAHEDFDAGKKGHAKTGAIANYIHAHKRHGNHGTLILGRLIH